MEENTVWNTYQQNPLKLIIASVSKNSPHILDRERIITAAIVIGMFDGVIGGPILSLAEYYASPEKSPWTFIIRVHRVWLPNSYYNLQQIKIRIGEIPTRSDMTINSRTNTQEIHSEAVSTTGGIILEKDDIFHLKAKNSKQRTQTHGTSSVLFCGISLRILIVLASSYVMLIVILDIKLSSKIYSRCHGNSSAIDENIILDCTFALPSF